MSDEEKHSVMLGQIAGEVEEFCLTEDWTTVDAVRLLKAKYEQLKAQQAERELMAKYNLPA